MSFGNVNLSLCSDEVRLILLGEAVAIRERQRLVLGGSERARDHESHCDQRGKSTSMTALLFFHGRTL